MDWFYLGIAGIFEISFTTCLKMASIEGNNKTLWNLAFILCAIISFAALECAIQTIPLGTAYAVWTGIGACGTAIIGIYIFHDPATFARLFFLLLLITAIIGLKIVS